MKIFTKKQIALLALGSLLCRFDTSAQDTFSIVAADSATGEVGSAGASCIDNSIFAPKGAHIISVISPGIGAVNVQASLNTSNKFNAQTRLDAGDSAPEIISYVTANDAQGDSTIRQYGAVTIDTNAIIQTAAFTGDSCLDYKNHIVGPSYTIQGNILIGQHVLDSMESRFVNTKGDLATKLMAALQGANIPGADSRCLADSVSSLSAFIRLAKPNDDPSDLYMDLAVYSLPQGTEPIDELQKKFDNFVPDTAQNTGVAKNTGSINWYVSNQQIIIQNSNKNPTQVTIYDLTGKVLLHSESNAIRPVLPTGMYILEIHSENVISRERFFWK